MTIRQALFALAPCAIACAETPTVAEPNWSGEASESALIWSGFDHQWGYNHRLNRLGNWVGPIACDRSGCTGEVAHAAASGIGSDTAAWSARATAVTAPGVGFLAGSTPFEFALDRAEGKYVEQTRIVSVPTEGLLADRSQYTVLLGGYDVFALEDADMFRALAIEVGEVTVDARAGVATFPVTFGLHVDCDAFECDGVWDVGGKVDQSLHYGAIVMWQVIAADDPIDITTTRVADGYAWQDAESDEIEREDFAIDGTVRSGRGAASRDHALVGVQALRIALDHPSHFVQIATGVSEATYDPATGSARYRADLFFKQWNSDMLDLATSYATPGETETSATFALVRFDDATVTPITSAGSVVWSADGAPATDESAVDRQAVRFGRDPDAERARP